MNQIEFESQHEAEWNRLAQALDPPKKGAAEATMSAAAVPALFRRLAAELAIARDRQYRTSLLDRLHALVVAAHFAVHGARVRRRGGMIGDVLSFFLREFPAEVRRQWPFVTVAAATFFIPTVASIIALQWFPDFVYYLVSPDRLSHVQSMYSDEAMRFGAERGADSDIAMFGFYILNNVRIDLQCLAGGIFFGLGTLVVLLANGIFFGAIAGHLTQAGLGRNFWGFVVGHSAPELVGMTLASAAGLMIGYALIAPGRKTRVAALKERAQSAAILLYGAALMTVCAAVIEAFWSSRVELDFYLKLVVGAVVATLTIAFLALGGRERGP
ncbi:MAG TPA: stage II sporulation protein M [Usitatibacter sp.]|nr:stage II sporulation protein M [Usitatibacter sp.]